MRIILLLVAFVTLSMPETSYAGFINGNELYQSCSAERNTSTYYSEYARCYGYVIGVYDDLALSRAARGLSDCSPSGLIAGQLIDVVTQSLRDHPARRNLPGAYLVWLAITEAWPACKS